MQYHTGEQLQIGNLLSNYTVEKANIRSERDELVQKFLERLNQAREGTKYKPLTARAVAIKLSHVPTRDLWAFYKQCEQAKSFSAYFFWALKPR